tara:strand:+ start:64 stop:378 length:315 start_codon:yes stop_codon:yes gene_type:complete
MTTVASARAELKRMYNETSPATIERDLALAISLLKQLKGEAERAEVAIYMDGLSQMRSEWILAKRAKARKQAKTGAKTSSPTPAGGGRRTKRTGKPRPKNKRSF